MSGDIAPPKSGASRQAPDAEIARGSAVQSKAGISGMVEDFEQNTARLEALAGVLRAEQAAIETRIHAIRTSGGKRLELRSELDAFTLINVGAGASVYIVAGGDAQGDWICPDCLADGWAVSLRAEPATGDSVAQHVCPRCNFFIQTGTDSAP